MEGRCKSEEIYVGKDPGMLRDGASIIVQHGLRIMSKEVRHTNLAFFKHVSTSDGRVSETCGWVASADASQLRGGCCC